MSHAIYDSNAARQRAYRERQRAARPTEPTLPEPEPRKPRSPARPARILALAHGARELAAEYQSWRDKLPANLAEGETAGRLEEVIAQLEDAAETLEAIEPPAVGR